VYLPPATYHESRAIDAYADRAMEGLRAIPGGEAVAAARVIPFTDSTVFGVMLTFPNSGEKRPAQFNWNAVTPDYFRAMDIPIFRGRPFGAQDKGATRVVIVNDEFVRRYLGTREPVGTTFSWTPGGRPLTIVGVVRATKNMTIGEDPRAQMYEPLAQINNDRSRIQLVIRSAVPPVTQLPAVRQALRAVEPAAGLEVDTMFAGIGFAFLPSQVGAALMGAIGLVALLLAVMGLYGVLTYSISRRTREIGIRMAVGASPQQISRMVLRELTGLLVAGIGSGVAISLVLTRPLAIFLVPGLSASDPASFAGAIALLVLTGALASLGPIRRARIVSPLECLRCQ
jgi:hypothetical protein